MMTLVWTIKHLYSIIISSPFICIYYDQKTKFN